MKFKHMKVKLMDIIPQQHYLSIDKYNSIKKTITDLNDYGDIYVIEYKNKIFSVDGHHRLYYLYKNGITEVNVICELTDNNNRLYQILAEEAMNLGLSNISDLENRFIKNYAAYKKKWIDKCNKILSEIKMDI